MTGLRWGIMGTGNIAGAMAGVLESVGSPLMAVGSARPGAPESFAQQWGVPRAVHSHRAVAEIDEVDIVYVATTNDQHFRNVLDCVDLGKPVLCEKPLAVNARQAAEMLRVARDAEVFLMEALWMCFQPFLGKVDGLIADGAIGKIRHVQADLFFPAPRDASRRWMSLDLGGGSLLDLGVYPLNLVHHLLGPPTSFEANAHVGPTGVDLDTTVLSHHEGDSSASVTSAFTATTTNEAVVSGTEARIVIHAPFHHSPLVTLERRGEVVASYDTSIEGHGFRFEIAEAERCVKGALTESRLRSHADTLGVLEWMDAIRARCGIEFPADAT